MINIGHWVVHGNLVNSFLPLFVWVSRSTSETDESFYSSQMIEEYPKNILVIL